MKMNLKKYLLISFLYLPALGLFGCNGARQLGLRSTEAVPPTTEAVKGAACINKENANISSSNHPINGATEVKKEAGWFANGVVIAAGAAGKYGFGAFGGAVAGIAGGTGGLLYAACTRFDCQYAASKGVSCSHPDCKYNSFASHALNGLTNGFSYGYSITSCFGECLFKGIAHGLILGTPYVLDFTKWAGCNAYNGIKYAASSTYNGLVKVHQGLVDMNSVLNQDEAEDWEMVDNDNSEKGTELQSFPPRCPLGQTISKISGATS